MDPTSLQHFLTRYPCKEIFDNNGQPAGQFVTCPVRIAFARLNEPRERVNQQTGEKFNTWGAVLIVPPQADISVAQNIAMRAAETRFGPNWRSMELNNPFRPQANNNGKYDGFGPEGFYFDTESRFAVPVFGGRPGPDGKLPKLDTSDGNVVYSGMWALALLNVYTYPGPSTKGPSKKGVKFGLRQLQKICDDDPFKGGDEPNDAFGAVEHLHGQQQAQQGGFGQQPAPPQNGFGQAPAGGFGQPPQQAAPPQNGFGQQAPQQQNGFGGQAPSAPANPGNPNSLWGN